MNVKEARSPVDVDRPNFDLLAAALRADRADMATWIATLGPKLAQALPVRVKLRHGGIFGNGQVDGVSADLGAYRFAMRLEHGQPVAERTHIVRGITLKTESLPLDAWLDALAQELADLAATSARERDAIMRLLT
jgi:hypothetical protein